MFIGAHVILYSRDAESDREFFRDVLKFPAVDAGRGWLLFKLPAAEAAFHPSENNDRHELYFMCDDLENELKLLEEKNVYCGPVIQERWGNLTTITLPGGGKIGLYQPKHPTAINS